MLLSRWLGKALHSGGQTGEEGRIQNRNDDDDLRGRLAMGLRSRVVGLGFSLLAGDRVVRGGQA